MHSEVEKAAQRLRRAIARAEDGAGTPPAKIAVKLIPSDWHNVVAAAKESASLIETLYRREEELPRIYIDCEFNGWMGELLSFAMVAEDGREFYSVLPEPRTWDKWCFENVFPVLNKAPVASYADFRLAFIEFLRGYREPIIIADWPADLYYFNKVLLGNGHEESILIPCRMQLVGCDYVSTVPHNALEDARAILRALAGDHGQAGGAQG